MVGDGERHRMETHQWFALLPPGTVLPSRSRGRRARPVSAPGRQHLRMVAGAVRARPSTIVHWQPVHALTTAVLDAAGGNLRDDATALCLDWYGGDPNRDRDTTAGASTQFASN